MLISQQPRPQATPPVSQHASQHDQYPGYNPSQQPTDQYLPSGQQVDPIRAVAPSAPVQPLYSTATLMQGQQQHPPLQYNQQVFYDNDPTQSLRQRSLTGPLGNNLSGYIAGDRNPSQHQNQRALHRVQEDGGEHIHQRGLYESDQRQYSQREQQQGARQMMESSSQGGPPHPHAYNQAPSIPPGRGNEFVTITSRGAMNYGSGAVVSQAQPHEYVNLNFTPGGPAQCSPSEQNRGQDQGYPHNHQYPQTNQPNPQYPTTSQGYQPNQQHPQINQGYQGNQQHPQMNQGYQGNQGYPQTNRDYPQNQQFPPTGQPYNIPNQQMQPGGQDQGFPNNQRQPPPTRQPYNPPNQGQAGSDHLQGAGVRRQDSSPPHRPPVGSQGTYSAQGPSPQGPYGGSAVDVPPEVRQVQGHPPPVAAPRSGRRSVKSQPSPPMNQRAYPDQPHQPAQPNQRDQPDQLVLPDQTGQRDQANQIAQTNQAGQPNQLAQQNQPGPPDQPAEPDQRTKQETSVQENILLQGIDDDIHQAVEEVQKEEEDENEASLSEVPFDPNLVCPLCMKQFRLGEIQKYRRHVGKCQGQ